MKIKLLVSRSGPLGAQNRGDEIDLPNAEAIRLVESGQAEPVRTESVERTVKVPKRDRAAK